MTLYIPYKTAKLLNHNPSHRGCFNSVPLQSQNSAKLGAIKAARSQGMVAAYLSCTAAVFALILATILTGLVVGLYSGTYYLNQCLEKGEINIS